MQNSAKVKKTTLLLENASLKLEISKIKWKKLEKKIKLILSGIYVINICLEIWILQLNKVRKWGQNSSKLKKTTLLLENASLKLEISKIKWKKLEKKAN